MHVSQNEDVKMRIIEVLLPNLITNRKRNFNHDKPFAFLKMKQRSKRDLLRCTVTLADKNYPLLGFNMRAAENHFSV